MSLKNASTRVRSRGRRRWQVVIGEWRIGKMFERAADQVLSRPASLAGSHVAGRGLLSADKKISTGRVVRSDIADTTFRGINRCEHCGRPWPGEHRVIRSIPTSGAGLAERIGGTFASCPASRDRNRSRAQTFVGLLSERGKNVACPYSLASAKRGRTVRQLATRYSLLAIRRGNPNAR